MLVLLSSYLKNVFHLLNPPAKTRCGMIMKPSFKSNEGLYHTQLRLSFSQRHFHETVPRGLRQELNLILIKVLDIMDMEVFLVQKPDHSNCYLRYKEKLRKPNQQECTAQQMTQ